MTLPDERYAALKHGRRLIEELCDPGKTPRVPAIVRSRARSVLRHYPNDWEFERMAERCPELLETQSSMLYNAINKQVANEKD